MSISLNIDIPEERSQALLQLPKLLYSGGLCILPTDTIYGISCCTLHYEGESQIMQLKGKKLKNTIPILINSIAMLRCFMDEIPPLHRKLIDMYWPAPLTIIFPTYSGERAFRMPFNDFLLRLIELTGPLSISSANYHGETPIGNIEELKKKFKVEAYLYSNNNNEKQSIASTVIKVNDKGEIEVLREGLINLKNHKIL